MATPAVRYLVFDVEGVADMALVARQRYAGQALDDRAALERFRRELFERYENDLVPYTYQIPAAVGVAKVAADFTLLDVAVLDEPEYRPHVMTEQFWRGWTKYKQPTLVSFHGRAFDLPVLELAAFRYGLRLPTWFQGGKGNSRGRFNSESHFDVEEFLTNFGATRFTGGLNLSANLLGKPGRMIGQDDRVQDMWLAGRRDEISQLCRWDVLDTYFVFLRSRVLVGQMTLDDERERVQGARTWLEARAEQQAAYRQYLEHWGDWANPWAEPEAAEKSKSGKKGAR
ncbi:MAG: 3'-5' exonuclease [Planctomycetes bacterium]|nr:3'-5' exonuclease [Planctomycetota bacterium]